MRIQFTVNGTTHEVSVAPGTDLLHLLRDLGYTSVKNGCDRGDCGSCAVLVDGRAVNACLLFAAKTHGARITTTEGLASHGELHPIQQAMIAEGGVQCGFCTPGIMLTVLELFERDPDADEAAIRTALAGNLCRCTGWVKPVAALLAAARRDREDAE